MTVRIGKWWLLAAAVSVFGLTACDDGDDKNTCDVATYKPNCLDAKVRNLCVNGIIQSRACDVSCEEGLCFGKDVKDCTENTCVAGKEVLCIKGKAAEPQACSAGFVCVDKVGCEAVVPECVAADYPKCEGKTALTCTAGKVVSVACLTGQICVDKKGCETDVKNPCTEADTACQGGKLMTCTDGDWISSNCASGEVCEGKACVKVVEECIAADYPKCEGKTALTCTGGKVVSVACLTGQICVDKKGCETDVKNPCTEADTACQGGKLMTCTDGDWISSNCASGEVCVGKACVKDTPVTPVTVPVEACGKLTITGSDTCEKTGSGAKTVLRGDVLALGKTYEGGSVVIENGKITYVGCSPDMAGATVITCPGAVVSPGLINAHEHIGYSNGSPAKWGAIRFDHRHDWRTGSGGHTKVPGPQTTINEVPELRSLMGGATSMFGSGSVKGLIRNLDKETTGGVKAPVYQTFPLNDTDGTMADSGCSKYKYKKDEQSGCAYGPHIAEGINMAAYNELVCLSTNAGGGHDVFNNRLAIIHGIAATPEMIADMAEKGIKLIWSPRTNVALYGDTAQAPLFDRMGVTVGLGTDWIYSGSANMLRELACVDYLNANHYNKYFSDYQIWRMATYNNALALGVETVIGELKAGQIADISIFKSTETKKHHRAVINAENKDVVLVLLDGKLVYGDANIVTGCETADVCGSQKGICLSITGTSMTYASINGAKKYDLFFCNTPTDEPTCVPQRTRTDDTTKQSTTLYSGDFTAANDSDGDGILDAVDNCPNYFNPVRPQDLDRKQRDFDGDTIGDICDLYPLCAANDETCPKFDVTDTDNDGVKNDVDNCPTIANPDQKDTDLDGKGDVCDACPTIANPGDLRCPVTKITPIKDFITLVGTECKTSPCKGTTEVRIAGRVTAITKDGFFIQNPQATDVKFNATYVLGAGVVVKLNDDVEVQGFPGLNFDQVQMQEGQTKVISSGNAAIVATPIDVAKVTTTVAGTVITHGVDAQAYENVLVSASNLTVQEPDANAGYNMYPVKDSSGAMIYLDDFVWIIAPKLVSGDSIKKATGVLVIDFKNYKIAPRDINDIMTNVVVKSLVPDATLVEFGKKTNVLLTLSQNVEVATTVALSCVNATCPASIVVAKDSATQSFEITMAASGDAKITASLAGRDVSVTITGYDTSLPLSIVSLDPVTADILVGKKLTVTAQLSRPATEIGEIALSSSHVNVATVPATKAIAIGESSVTFEVTVVATTAGEKAVISAKIGTTDAKTVGITTKVGSTWAHTEGFNIPTDTAYTSVTNVTADDGSKIVAVGVVTKDATKIIEGAGSLVLASNVAESELRVINMTKGVGSIEFMWRSWGAAADAGSFEITVGSVVKKFDYKTTDVAPRILTVAFDDSTATSIKIKVVTPTGSRGRIIIDTFKWSAGK